jgi:YVTN family beta-propeller protein
MRVLLLILPFTLFAQTPDKPVRGVSDPGVVTTRQSITPAGVPTVFAGKVHGVAFGKSADELWVLTGSHLFGLDWRKNETQWSAAHRGFPGLLGLATRAGVPYIGAVPSRGQAALFTPKGAELDAVAGGLGRLNTGGVALGGNLAVLPLTAENRAAVIDVETRQLKGYAPTGIAPFAAAVTPDGQFAYVSNWGGRATKAGERTAPTGLAPKADQVLVDARGVAASGTVTRIDLATLQPTHQIPVGLHPNGLALDAARNRLYVANNNSGAVSVIDTRTQTVAQTWAIQPFPRNVTGIAPTAVVVSADGRRVFVTCGGINAIAVLNAANGALEGLIPTGWYPNAIALSPDGQWLAVGSLLGVGSGWRDDPKKRYVHAYRGTVNVLPLPDAAQLSHFTLAVAANNHLPLAGTPERVAPRAAVAKAVPAQPGDPSLIEHIVYIVKENRTYDQVFGDLPQGNGDPSLVMFGEDVTPNQRQLARDFVLLDNFYATGGNSANGHQWLTQANEVAYTMWPGYQGRSYPYDGTDPLAIAQGGAIWNAALAKGKSVRIFGEYAGHLTLSEALRPGYFARWQRGEDFSKEWNVKAPIASMQPILAANFPSYAHAIPDVVRAGIFLQDLKQWEETGQMPNLSIMLLCNDHTSGTAPGASTPKAMVADNDLAVGLIVEALSKSKFWPKMAIFIVEDDAQNGVDHVDGHRTVALAISPYTRRRHVDSTFYSHQSMLKTIELMLGVPPMSLFDWIANDMRASFTDTPDLTPFAHVMPKQDLLERNPPARALNGPARAAALASAKMKFHIPDAAPTAKLNRILWGATRGWHTPYPGTKRAVFSPFALDDDGDDDDR